MKRLFRTSKTAVIDPLPPPTASTTATGSNASTPRQLNQSLSSLTLNGNNNGNDNPNGIASEQHEHRWGFGHRQKEVTPFPSELGRGPSIRKRNKDKDRENTRAPSMLEIQEMQEKERRFQSQQQQQSVHRRSSHTTPPDGWVVSPSRQHTLLSTGYDPPYADQSQLKPMPHPFNNISTSASSSPSPSPQPQSQPQPLAQSQSPLYLPPGARPPSPSLRRPSYASQPRHSQSSFSSSNTPFVQGDSGYPSPKGRDRGQSIVSTTGSMSARSEHEAGTGSGAGGSMHTSSQHSHNYNHNTSQTLSPQQPPSSTHKHSSRSPLVHSYALADNDNTVPSFPTPHPFARAVSPISPAETPPNPFPATVPSPAPGTEDMPVSLNLHNLPARGEDQPKDKEKKRFWGMGWSKNKDKDKDKDKGSDAGDFLARPSIDEGRRSNDGWDIQSQSQSTSAHGVTQEDAPRGRILGLDFGGAKRDAAVGQVNDVTSAIRMLCATSDPSSANILDVCERIDHSDAGDSICKEAARALRKEFKYGNDPERCNAAKVWLMLMRNVSIKGFKSHMCNKKFLQILEPILLATPAKPLVIPSTHRLITDVLADLTYSYGTEKGCEGLIDLWKKVKMPQEPDIGRPLSADHSIFNPEPILPPHFMRDSPYASPPQSISNSRQTSTPSLQQHNLAPGFPPVSHQRTPSPSRYGPVYASLPNHNDDLRRLTDECTAAKESARVLSEALVYTRPEELELKPVIGEFYRKVFHAHESLTNQMDWAQAEASRSRERHASLTLAGPMQSDEGHHESTAEENALAALFEAHSALSEALKQHDEMERMAMDERELREVSERSKKETRMDRSGVLEAHGGLSAPQQGQGGSSRSPSPAPHARLPVEPIPKLAGSPRQFEVPLPNTIHAPFKSEHGEAIRSRTPSPDRLSHPLPHLPKLGGSPGRTNSPLGGGGRSKMGPRPLPDPFKGSRNASQASLAGIAATNSHSNGPSRSGTGDTNGSNGNGHGHGNASVAQEELEAEDLPPMPVKPSRKALGKRRAVVDEDNTFDPNDMFNPVANPRPTAPTETKDGDDDSDESLLADAVYGAKPVVYAYDAYEERQRELRATALTAAGGSGSGSGSGSGFR